MSKPKKGYTRWTVDIKTTIAEKIKKKAFRDNTNAKELCQQAIETTFSQINKQQ